MKDDVRQYAAVAAARSRRRAAAAGSRPPIRELDVLLGTERNRTATRRQNGKAAASGLSRVRIAARDCLPSHLAFIVLSFLACTGCVSDEHRSVTKQMGWQCVGIEDTGNQRFPHVESIK